MTESVDNAVNILFNTVYHRIRLMNPQLKYLGYGSYKKGDQTIHVFDFGYDTEYTSESLYHVYPAENATDVQLQWSGYELPDPLPAGTVKPLGAPITALFTEKITSTVITEIVNADTGEMVEHYPISPDNDINKRKINAVILVPIYILNPLTTYNVSITVVKENEEEQTVAWSFTTTELVQQ